MPRFFFNIYHERAELDEVGEELPDLQSAWHEATITAGQILQDLDGKLRPGKDWRMEVMDESLNRLFVIFIRAKTVPFAIFAAAASYTFLVSGSAASL